MKTHATAYQIALLVFAALTVVLTGVFVWREIFPEYKTYQIAYIELEKARAELTHGEPAPFQTGIKQIVYYETTPGPQQIDRCISCHTAMQNPAYSPTRVRRDINGNIVYNAQGTPVQEQNPDYVFTLLPHLYNEEIANTLVAHPLLGAETRPFELHPLEQYGCTSCHSGNGRSVNAKRAHGPVFDEEYEAAEGNPVNPYVEIDTENDPEIARVFNFKPDHDLLFQTRPLLPGPLMEAKCAACHKTPDEESQALVAQGEIITQREERKVARIAKGIENTEAARLSLLETKRDIELKGLEGAKTLYADQLQNPLVPPEKRDAYAARLEFLSSTDDERVALAKIHNRLLGPLPPPTPLEEEGILTNYSRGKELFMSQACYGCHRIDGLSRGGVGPDLTEIGLSYPWYVKMSIVWPQGKLPGSAMPNFRLDHEEVSDLLAYLCAQDGDDRSLSQVHKEVLLKAWEAGHPLPWEAPIPPADMTNVRYALKVFANQGCAACHKLRGYEGDISGDQEWFLSTFPQLISGQQLVRALESDEVDTKLTRTGKTGTLLQELDWDLISSYYTPFRFASRAKDAQYEAMLAAAITPTQRKEADLFHDQWQERVDKTLTMFIQEYGLGRDIGPRLNWSGIWRDKQWLIGHFLNPTAYSPRSIMPTFPFDISKFYSLTHMLQEIGKQNRDWFHTLDLPPAAQFELLCSACHGTNGQGNGPVAEWIYPIPKNLRSNAFLSGLTREKAIRSIQHGVPGTPMPPWGTSYEGEPVLSDQQIERLVDWLFASVPASPVTPTETETTPEMLSPQAYTPQNIEAGQALFQTLCAHCHGTEAMGNGPRAEMMVDAKPRMLVNLPWLQDHTDEELLHAIKYGVPGTSMPALGDRTTEEQRAQLVVYIRTLAHEKVLRDQLTDTLYNVFDTKIFDRLLKGEDPSALQERRLQLQQIGESFITRDVDDQLFASYLRWIQHPEEKDVVLQQLDAQIAKLHAEREQILARLRSGPRSVALEKVTEQMGGYMNLKTQFLAANEVGDHES